MEPEQQEHAAALLVREDRKSLDDPQAEESPKQTESPQEQKQAEESIKEHSLPTVPYTLGNKKYETLEESIADLKNPNKDCRYTPDTLLADIDGFVQMFHKSFVWYHNPFCTVVFPCISRVQFDYVKQRFESISYAMDNLLDQMEGAIKV